jgi:exonuclease 3'-5' domain-containing protein 1
MASTATLTNDDLLRSIEKMQGLKLEDGSSYTVVDSDSALSDMIDTLAELPVTPPSMYVDLEGVNLSRQGTIPILQFYVLPKDCTYLVDIHQLQHAAFSTTGKHSGKSLKAILEAEDIPKVFFDVRNDSDALYHHFQISLSGVHDIQLMELATRRSNRRCVNGLQR